MTWSAFLDHLNRTSLTAISLVGPLYDAEFTPAEPTVFIDGGSRFRPLQSDFPLISVGDGDSGSAVLDEILPSEKDYSDLAFVLRNLPAHVARLSLHGFSGGRLDHELANFGELHAFLLKRGNGQTHLFAGGRPSVVGFNSRLEMNIQGIFSLLVLEPAEVRLTGDCKYKLTEPYKIFPCSSHGISNSGFGRVLAETSNPAFIFLS